MLIHGVISSRAGKSRRAMEVWQSRRRVARFSAHPLDPKLSTKSSRFAVAVLSDLGWAMAAILQSHLDLRLKVKGRAEKEAEDDSIATF